MNDFLFYITVTVYFFVTKNGVVHDLIGEPSVYSRREENVYSYIDPVWQVQ
jgi:hypothetical protein